MTFRRGIGWWRPWAGRGLGAVALLAASIVGAAAEVALPSDPPPSAPFGCPEPGTVFTLSIMAANTGRENRHVALGDEADACWIRSDAQGPYRWVWGISPDYGKLDPRLKAMAGALWPLAVGKRSVDAGEGWSVVYEVAAFEPLVTLAATYDTFQIVKTHTGPDGTTVTRLWWSPDLRWTLRQYSEKSAGPKPAAPFSNWTVIHVARPSRLDPSKPTGL